MPPIDPLRSNPNPLSNRITYWGQGFDGARVNISPQVYQTRDWMLQNLIRPGLAPLAAGPIFNALRAQTGVTFGHPLFANLPGRMFNAGPNGFYHNGGTSSETMVTPDGRTVRRYIPPMYVANNGAITFQRLIAYADRPQYARPANFGNAGNPELRQQMLSQGVQELDLGSVNPETGRWERGRAIRTLDDGRKVYNRQGFNGEYEERMDGGITFSGNREGHVGSHESGVRLIRQIYYANALAGQSGGRWHHWGPEAVGSTYGNHPITYTSSDHGDTGRTVTLPGVRAGDMFAQVRYTDSDTGEVRTVAIPPGGLQLGMVRINQNGTINYTNRRPHDGDRPQRNAPVILLDADGRNGPSFTITDR